MPTPAAPLRLLGIAVADPRSPWDGQRVDALLDPSGRLLELTPAGQSQSAQPAIDSVNELSAEGQVLAPALADAWCHVPDPGYETRATLDAVAAEAYAGGYADILAMPTTRPVVDRAEVLRGVLSRSGGLPTRVHWAGALTQGARGSELAELIELAQVGARAYTDGASPVQHPGLLLRALQYARWAGPPVLQLPLEAQLAAGQHAAESAHNTRLGFKGMSPLAEGLALQRDLALVEATGAAVHFSPITTRRGVELIAAAKRAGLPVTASTAPIYLVRDDTALASFDTAVKVIPPLRTADDRAALVAALADGTLDLMASHQQPLTPEEKALEWDYALAGATTLSTAFAAAYTALVATGHCSLSTLIERLAHAPRRLLGLPLEPVAVGATRLVRIVPTGAPPPPTALHTWPLAGVSLVGSIHPLW